MRHCILPRMAVKNITHKALTIAFAQALILAMLFCSTTASAAPFGAYVQGQAGYGEISENLKGLSYGWTVGLELMGIQGFYDTRTYIRGGESQELGLGLNLSFPISSLELYIRPTVGVIQIDIPQLDHSQQQPLSHRGLDGSLHAGIDYEFLKFLNVGVQGNVGYLYGIPESGEQFSVMGVLRLKL